MVATVADAPAAAVLVAGATGLVGQAVLAGLLTDKHVTAVHAVGRRPLALQHRKLTSHAVDFAHLSTLPSLGRIDEAYIALGTTLKVAGSRAAFRAVDLDAVLAVAQLARQAGATRLGVVSAMGADANSSVFYNRIKGEMEQALQSLNFPVLVIARPSLLLGNRAALAQAPRLGEHWGGVALRWLKPLIPADYQPIAAASVAQALVHGVRHLPSGTHVLRSGALQRPPPLL